MDDHERYIRRLEERIASLEAELKKERRRARDLEDTRKAFLNLLEDLQDLSAMIQEAKKQWEETFDAIAHPILIHDRDLRIIRANRAYKDSCGLPFSEIIGRPYYEVFPRSGRPADMCMDLKKGGEGMEEVTLPSGRRFIVRLYPIRDHDGNFLYSIHIFEDVTDLKVAEEALRKEVALTKDLLSISEATAHTSDINAFMREVTRCVRRAMGFKVCLSYLWEGDGLEPCHAAGLGHWHIPFFRTTPLKEKEIRLLGIKKRDICLLHLSREDRQGLERIHPWIKGAGTLVSIPLYGRREAFGLLIGVYEEEKELTEKDERLLEGISHQVSLALEEGRLYRDLVESTMRLSRTIETMKVMHEIDRQILSTLNPEEIMEVSTRMVSRLLPCEIAALAMKDKERDFLTYTSGFAEGLIIRDTIVPCRDTRAAEVMETGMILYIPDVREEEGLLPFEERLLKEGFLSHIMAPITVKGERMGVFHVASKKPAAFSPEDLSTLERVTIQVAVAFENSRLLTDLKELFTGIITALANAIDAKSPWTKGHSERVTSYAVAIAQEMGMDEKGIEDIRIAGLLHDIGKIGTYDVLLDKPGRLTEEEYEIVKRHPEKGVELLYPIKHLRHILPWIRHHHERWDGKGYPDGLKGQEIPLQARILAVADTFDSMTAERPYRQTPGREKAVEELRRCSGTQFDPDVVDAFLRVLPELS